MESKFGRVGGHLGSSWRSVTSSVIAVWFSPATANSPSARVGREHLHISDSKVKGAVRVLRIVLYKRQLLVGVPES